MEESTAQRAIEVPIDSLPPVDEHGVEIRADAERTWDALAAMIPRIFATGRAARASRLLGCVFTEARGNPTVIGSGGHILVVRRILSATRKRAEGKRATVDRGQIREWVSAYERAWRTDGTGPLPQLFAKDATYSTGPFERPHRGLDAIAEMWARERLGPDEVFEMTAEVIAIEGDTGVVRVEVRYGPPKEQLYRDLWIVRLNADGRCVHFEEWPFWPPGTEGAAAQGAGN